MDDAFPAGAGTNSTNASCLPLSGEKVPPARSHAGEPALDLRVISSSAGLVALQHAWDDLLSRIDEPCPFAGHAWTRSWWECFGETSELHVVTAWRNAQLCGIAPLMLATTRWYGMPVRRLGCLYNAHVQRMDFPVLDACREEFHDALWRHALAIQCRWDVLELNQFSRDSGTLPAIEARAAESGLRLGHWTQGASPYLSLTGRWEDYLAGLSANRRGTLRRKLRRLSEQGEVRMERIRSGVRIDAALDEGFRIESLAWKGREGTAVLSAPSVLRFYRSLAALLAKKGRGLALYFLTVDDQRIAFHYCLETGSAIHLLKPGYDPAWSRYSPSELLTFLALEQAFVEGRREYDFLGDSDDWKLKWSTTTRDNDWLYVFNDSPRGRLAHVLKVRVVPGLKKLASIGV